MSYINGIINNMIEKRIDSIKKDYPSLSVELIDENVKKPFKKEIKKTAMDNLVENMFKKPWGKLPYFHREMKIIEFARKNNQNEKELKKALYEKKLTAKAIEYDEKNGLILSVNYKL
jgi:ATP-dependent protease HslVU (ClpYQ) ATPase subunit